VSDVTRLLCAAVLGLVLLPNPGCNEDSGRRADTSLPNGNLSPDAANPVRADAARGNGVIPGDGAAPIDGTAPMVGLDAPSRRAESSSQAAADANRELGASIPSAAETPYAREALQAGKDPRLVRALDPEASGERVQQIESLNASGDDLGTLLATLAGDPDPAVRVAAADMLAESDRGEAIDGLLLALGDPSREVVLQSLETLSLVGERETVPSIKPLLDHDDVEIREAAADTLYFVDDSELDEPSLDEPSSSPDLDSDRK